jgi:predicted dehydrogenase
MGNQGTSRPGLRTAVEIVRSGALGDVREVHVWTNRPIWPQNVARPKERETPPKTLHWDLWLGTAPERPFHQGKGKQGTYAPFNWRGWWDFGTGALGDMACHTMNLPYLALRLGAPTAVTADLDPKGSVHIAETAPMGCTVTYEFPQRGSLVACRLFWYERRQPPAEKLMGQKPSGSGCMIIGSKGSMYSTSDYGESYVLLPGAAFQGYKPPTPTLPRAEGGHHQEWIRACKGGPQAMSNFVDHAGPLTETVLLGNVAMRVGKRVVWDAEKLRAVGLPEADRYIRREYRKGWSL